MTQDQNGNQTQTQKADALFKEAIPVLTKALSDSGKDVREMSEKNFDRYFGHCSQINILMLGAWIALYSVDKIDLSRGLVPIIFPCCLHITVLSLAGFSLWILLTSHINTHMTLFNANQVIAELQKLGSVANLNPEVLSKIRGLVESVGKRTQKNKRMELAQRAIVWINVLTFPATFFSALYSIISIIVLIRPARMIW